MEKLSNEYQSSPQQILAAEEQQLILDAIELEQSAPSHLDSLEIQIGHLARTSELAGRRELLDRLKQQF